MQDIFRIPAESFQSEFDSAMRRHLIGGAYVDDTFKDCLFADCLEGYVMSTKATYPMDKYIGYYVKMYFQHERHSIHFQFSDERWTRQPELVGMDSKDLMTFNVIIDDCIDEADDVEVCRDCIRDAFVGMMNSPVGFSVKEMRSLCRECDDKVSDGSAVDYGFRFEDVLDEAYKSYRKEQARLCMAKKRAVNS